MDDEKTGRRVFLVLLVVTLLALAMVVGLGAYFAQLPPTE